MGVGSHLTDVVYCCQFSEDTGFHQRGVGLVQVTGSIARRHERLRVAVRQLPYRLILLIIIHTEQPHTAFRQCLAIQMVGEHQQQLLTLVPDRDNVYFPDHMPADTVVKVVDGLVPVEHRRQLQRHRLGLVCQFPAKGQHIGLTVADGIGLAAMVVASRRVEIDKGGMRQSMQIVHAIAIHHLGLAEAKEREILR